MWQVAPLRRALSPFVAWRAGCALALVLFASGGSVAFAQPSTAPIAVPTAPVPLVTTPDPVYPRPSSPPPPRPAPPPITDSTRGEPARPSAASTAPAASGDAKSPPPPIRFNNEGVFKITGSKGSTKSTAKPGAPAPGPASDDAPARAGKRAHARSPHEPRVVAEWPGFRNTPDGASEVVVAFSKAAGAPTEHRAAGSVTYAFHGAHVLKHNNRNPLLTVHFNTPVMSARLVPTAKDLQLVIELRPGVNVWPSTSTRPGADGTGEQFVVKFPAGDYLPAGGTVDIAPPTPKASANASRSKRKRGKKAKDTTTPSPVGPTP